MKKKAKADKVDPMEKLLKLTKLLKRDKVAIDVKAPARGVNKWRSYDPKFGPKPPRAENVVQAGGMDVDPARQQEYENWRKDKLAEQNDRRIQHHRNALAKAKMRAERDASSGEPLA